MTRLSRLERIIPWAGLAMVAGLILWAGIGTYVAFMVKAVGEWW